MVFLGPNIVSWSSRKQPTVSKSSCETEFRSLATATQELIWIQSLLKELGVNTEAPTLWCDNIGAICLSANPMYHPKIKHFDVNFNFVRERVQSKELLTKYIPTTDQLADVLTKPLRAPQFSKIRDKLVCSSGN